jgi:hypothetical protein
MLAGESLVVTGSSFVSPLSSSVSEIVLYFLAGPHYILAALK